MSVAALSGAPGSARAAGAVLMGPVLALPPSSTPDPPPPRPRQEPSPEVHRGEKIPPSCCCGCLRIGQAGTEWVQACACRRFNRPTGWEPPSERVRSTRPRPHPPTGLHPNPGPLTEYGSGITPCALFCHSSGKRPSPAQPDTARSEAGQAGMCALDCWSEKKQAQVRHLCTLSLDVDDVDGLGWPVTARHLPSTRLPGVAHPGSSTHVIARPIFLSGGPGGVRAPRPGRAPAPNGAIKPHALQVAPSTESAPFGRSACYALTTRDRQRRLRGQ